MRNHKRHFILFAAGLALVLADVLVTLSETEARTIVANVVALDQSITYNRMGVIDPGGMIFALRRDVVDSVSGLSEAEGGTLTAGQVRVRPDKRPRPLVLRMNVEDILEIRFQNLLALAPGDEQPSTRSASAHVMGLNLAGSISDDGSNVGTNPSSLVPSGGHATYRYTAEREGAYLMYSGGAIAGGENETGSLEHGLFGAVNVQPRGAEYYRSQITRDEMEFATGGISLVTGHRLINYDAIYPASHRFAGLPVVNMLDGNEIVHADLNAIITGPGRGNFSAGTYPEVNINAPTNSDEPRSRLEPFREFTIVFHDEVVAKQAFPEFLDPVLRHTLHGVRDSFAINYGTGGVGAEILGNRKGVGPMHECVECKYEEFFLTSWVVGDPAMIVDVPANATDPITGELIVGPKATRAFYPDDPSNVHHSYIGDHVKMRNLHAGKEHHIFHLHSHQWLRNPDSDNSAYLDSQHLGPGTSFTYEITYNGSGNRNQTPGDAIFHCHFYPHFAQGMWGFWRNHDVFEEGTQLLANGTVASDARALPDGEIAAGTPIPGVVPIPGRAMAPLPGRVHIAGGQVVFDDAAKNPGFPFFVPGIAGHRPPQPPLDMKDDGGLPRHLILAGTAQSVETRLDFSKELLTANARELPQEGTNIERVAMDYHGTRFHPTVTPEGSEAQFRLNGLPPSPGAPYAEPCIDDFGQAVGRRRVYRAAAIQLDMIMNKVGWHFPQSRILSLWDDVAPTLAGARPPEPLFFRANTDDCLTFFHTNLVPNVYEMDDFQIRTPTDTIGQHIHLVKFDVTSSDGSGNGFNYEDGTFSPQEVIERIDAINATGGIVPAVPPDPRNPDARVMLEAEPHPFFGTLGAQTTIQRWFVDDVRNNRGVDRTLRTIFTHDHFGPSTHQQAGLYASLVAEPRGSAWFHSETGVELGTRRDGGPTTWQAKIVANNPANSYREFLFQFADFQQAYEKGGGGTTANPVPDPAAAINPPARKEVGLPFLVEKAAACPGGAPLPCPEAISAADSGTFVVNYRNEPLALRVLDPSTNAQAQGQAGDLSFAYRSDVVRAIPELNVQPGFYPPLTGGLRSGDPFTPLMRTYQGDKVQVRVQVGATEESHNLTIHGMRWLQEPSFANSGYRNTQAIGISEHFELLAPITFSENRAGPFADHLYKMSASIDGQWNGLWGLMRAYDRLQPDLSPLNENPVAAAVRQAGKISNLSDFNGVCPVGAPVRRYDVSAVSVRRALPPVGTLGRTLVYNPRGGAFPGRPGPLHDPTAIMFVLTEDLNPDTGRLEADAPIEPLILRAAAGECIEVTLRNALPAQVPDRSGFSLAPMMVEHFNLNQVRPSVSVGLHPQLLSYDITRHDGANVGLNVVAVQTVAPGQSMLNRWYAGILTETHGVLSASPVEFGATNLMPADSIEHPGKGAVGALIVEPAGSTWVEDKGTRASATVSTPLGAFKEFVVVVQDSVNMRDGNDRPLPQSPLQDDPEDSGQSAVNYRTEPFWFRLGFPPDATPAVTRQKDFTNVLSNSLSSAEGDPETPVFTVSAGTPVRYRVIHPGGHQRNHTFAVHGHGWSRNPYTARSRRIGSNPRSMWRTSQEGIGPSAHFDFVIETGAGGSLGVPGDYLYRDHNPFRFVSGTWGIMRVVP